MKIISSTLQAVFEGDKKTFLLIISKYLTNNFSAFFSDNRSILQKYYFYELCPPIYGVATSEHF